MNKLFGAAALGAALLTGACQTTSTPSAGASMQLASAALPPSGFVEFCKRHPGDCASTLQAAEPIALDARRWEELQRVNADVNGSIRYLGDGAGAAGRRESWDYPDVAGDCEDFALEKRRRLVEAGWPEQNLLIALAQVPRVGPHAVLVAVTASGDFVLDVRESSVRPWEQLGYRWLKRQSPENPRVWRSIRSA